MEISYGRRAGQSNGQYQAPKRAERPNTLGLAAMVVKQFKQAIIARCGTDSVAALGRRFKLMDRENDRRLGEYELFLALQFLGIEDMTTQDAKLILQAVDKDGSGDLSFDEFLVVMRGDLAPRRAQLIDRAFGVLDKDKSGSVTMEEVLQVYNVECHPDVISRRKTPKEVMQSFVSMFDGPAGDGMISKMEFRDYYRNVSASIDNDDHFEMMISAMWKMQDGGYRGVKKGVELKESDSNSADWNGRAPQGKPPAVAVAGGGGGGDTFEVMVQFKDGDKKIIEVSGVDKNNIRAIKNRLYQQKVHGIAKVQVIQ